MGEMLDASPHPPKLYLLIPQFGVASSTCEPNWVKLGPTIWLPCLTCVVSHCVLPKFG
jgi:hypothetical protein